MSGRKTTYSYVSDDELRRLRNQAARASSLTESVRILNQLNAKNDAAISEYRNRINTMNRNMDNLNRQMSAQSAAAKKEVQQLRTQLQQTVNESNSRIQAMARQNEHNIANMQNRFRNDLNETRAELENTIATNNRRIEAAMEQNNRRIASEIADMNAQITDVRGRMDTIESAIQATVKDEATLLDMAREYARTAQILLQDLQENYRPELLLPGRMPEVVNQLQIAMQDIDVAVKMPANSATARATSRQAAAAALQLHQDVLQAEQEWNLHYQAARQVVDATAAQLEASRNLEISDEYGAATVDVDHWSDGDLSAIARRVDALNSCLEQADNMTIDQLDNVQNAGAQASKEIDDTTVFAAEAFYSSQDRVDIAADIAENLSERLGLQVEDHSYRGRDQRSSHRLHLKNPATGFEMVITQTPEKDPSGRIVNRLESDILNYGTCNMKDGDEIARGALSALRGLGFEQTDVQTVAGYENRQSDRVECTNIQSWANEKEPEVLKPDHQTANK